MENKKSIQKFLEWLLLFVGIGLIIGAIIQSRFLSGAAAVPENTGNPITSISTPIPAVINPCDKAYVQKITDLPSSKAQSWISEYQSCLVALTTQPDPRIQKPTINVQSTSTVRDFRYRRIAGLGVLAFGMNVPPGLKIATGEWFERKNESLIVVIAGSIDNGLGDLSQGGIIIFSYNKDYQPLPNGGIYPTPMKSGPVTIIDAIGETLILVSEDGTLFAFDVANKKFIPLILPINQNKPQRKASQGIIIENGETPLAGNIYKIENLWYQDNNNLRTTVLVGETKNTTKNGILIVVPSVGEPTALTQSQAYPIPLQGGPYRIIDVAGDQVVVLSFGLAGGLTIFDLPTRKFLSSQEIEQRPTDSLVATYESPILNRTPQPTVTLMPTPNWTKTMPAYP